MKEFIVLQILAGAGIVAVFSIWNISYEQYVISIIFLVAMIGVDMLFRTKAKIIIVVIKHILLNQEIENELNSRALVAVRKLGLFIILSGIVGIVSIIILNNWVLIGIKILGNGMGITCAIILNSFIIQVIMLLPIMLKIKYQKAQRGSLQKKRYMMLLNKMK